MTSPAILTRVPFAFGNRTKGVPCPTPSLAKAPSSEIRCGMPPPLAIFVPENQSLLLSTETSSTLWKDCSL